MSRRLVIALALATLLLLSWLFTPLRRATPMGTRTGTTDSPPGPPEEPGRLSSGQIPSGVHLDHTGEERAAVGGTSKRPEVEEASAQAYEALLGRLRELARREDFHERAWGIVEELARFLDEHVSFFARAAAEIRRPTGESRRVRAGLLMAMAMTANPDQATLVEAVLGEMRDLPEGDGELERSAWAGWGCRSRGPEGTRVRLSDFPSTVHVTEESMPVWPIVLDRITDEALQSVARRRIARTLAPEYGQVPLGPDTLARLRDETYTREIVTLVAFGTGAGRPGPARDQLFHLFTTEAYPELRAQDAALWCLARAARMDDELARELARRIAALMASNRGAKFLRHLVQESGRGDLVLEPLRSLLSGAGQPEDLLESAYGVDALLDLLVCDDEAVRRAAQGIAIDSLLDPTIDPRTRHLLMLQLRTGAPAVFVDVAQTLFATETDPETIDRLVNQIRLVPRGEAVRVRDDLIRLWDHPATADTRRQILHALASIGDEASLAFLRGVRDNTASDELLEMVTRLLDGDG